MTKDGVTTRNQKEQQTQEENKQRTMEYSKIEEKLNEINLNINELKPIKNELADLKQSMSFMAAKYDKFVKELENNKIEIKKMSKKLEEIKNTSNEKELKIKQLQEQVNNLEQYTRNHNIEIFGIPRKPEENCKEIVEKVAKELHINLRSDEIDVAHRTFTTNSKITPPIVAKITTRNKRDLLVQKKKLVVTNRNIPQAELGQNIFIQEHLTSANKSLLRLTRSRARGTGYKYVCFKHGKLLVRKDDNTVIRLYKEEEVQVKLQE